MNEIKREFGKHYLVEFIGCNELKISRVEEVQSSMLKAAQESNATLLKSHFSQFDPEGVSGFIFIKESHFSIHTWPEDRYAAFDIFTCGEMHPEAAINSLKESFEAKEALVKILQRGF